MTKFDRDAGRTKKPADPSRGRVARLEPRGDASTALSEPETGARVEDPTTRNMREVLLHPDRLASLVALVQANEDFDREMHVFENGQNSSLSAKQIWGDQARDGSPVKPKLNLDRISELSGVPASTLSNHFTAIEDLLGTYIAVHADGNSRKGGERSHHPEQTEAWRAKSDVVLGSIRTAEVTLDGRIWGAYAQMVLELFDFTALATRRLSAAPRRAWSLNDPFGREREPTPGPTRLGEESRDSYLRWLHHQLEAIKRAKHFTRGGEGSFLELDRLLPTEPERPPGDEWDNPDR